MGTNSHRCSVPVKTPDTPSLHPSLFWCLFYIVVTARLCKIYLSKKEAFTITRPEWRPWKPSFLGRYVKLSSKQNGKSNILICLIYAIFYLVYYIKSGLTRKSCFDINCRIRWNMHVTLTYRFTGCTMVLPLSPRRGCPAPLCVEFASFLFAWFPPTVQKPATDTELRSRTPSFWLLESLFQNFNKYNIYFLINKTVHKRLHCFGYISILIWFAKVNILSAFIIKTFMMISLDL